MKKLTLITAMLLGIAGSTFAQDGYEERERRSSKEIPQMEWNFNMPERYINVRDYAYLPNKGKVIIELNNPAQYAELKNLDATLKKFMQDIAFYRDSLDNGSGAVRIDYTLDEAYPFSKIRFKKHTPDGQLFMNRQNDIARLKVEQDTVHIYVKHNPLYTAREKGTSLRDYQYTKAQFYQLTFCVNDYTDIAGIAADKESLQHALDTIAATKKKASTLNPYNFPSSTRFNPYATDSQKYIENIGYIRKDARFLQYSGLVRSDALCNCNYVNASDYLSFDGNIGASLVRNMFAPYAEAGIVLTRQRRNLKNEVQTSFLLRANISSYFIFERISFNEFRPMDNLFVNAEIGESKAITFGLGYKVSGNSAYFQGPTGKAFVSLKLLKNGLTVVPEVIFTNNFRQVFPGVTLKVF